MKRNLLSAINILFFFVSTMYGQVDTEFWFAAPEVSASSVSFDSPIAFRFNAYDQASLVTVSMPADPSFTPLTLNVNAFSMNSIVIGALDFENNPLNQVNKKGILISSTSPISVYYEVIGGCQCNPEIFSLKGCNALGLDFFVPFQTLLSSSNLDSPQPRAKFDIVATTDQTSVMIVPTQDLVGHAALQPFSIILNRGESYSCHADRLEGALRPTGTHILSDKPIAVTMSDDLMHDPTGNIGSCRDLGGDQLIPVSKVGTEYVAVQGNFVLGSFVYVVATVDGTNVYSNGTQVGQINAGEAIEVPFLDESVSISSTFPVYALQLSGNGCEAGLAILTPIDYFLSNRVAFMRTTAEPFSVILVCNQKDVNGFTVNGQSGQIIPNMFKLIPGGDGLAAASIDLNLSIAPELKTVFIENSDGAFSAGLIHGAPIATGTRFCFVSDFGGIPEAIYQGTICVGDTLTLNNREFTIPGTYRDTLGNGTICDSVIVYNIEPKIVTSFSVNITKCPDEPLSLYGQTFYFPGEYKIIQPSKDSCFEEIQLIIEEGNQITFQIVDSVCVGQIYPFFGQSLSAPGIYEHILLNSNSGCDSLLRLTLSLRNQISISTPITLCPTDSIYFNNQYLHTAGIYSDTLQSLTGCDTIITLALSFETLIPISQATAICANESYIFGADTLSIAGVYTRIVLGQNGACDTLITINLQLLPQPNQAISDSICSGGTYAFNGEILTQSGIYTDTLQGVNGDCDTLLTLNLSLAYIRKDTSIEICSGATIQIGPNFISTPGVYLDTIQGIPCDTIWTWFVSFTPIAELTMDTILCPGTEMLYYGMLYSNPGSYTDTVSNGILCDTILHLNIAVRPNIPKYLPTDTTYCSGNIITLYSPYEATVWGDLGVGMELQIMVADTIQVFSTDMFGCTRVDTLLIHSCCGNAQIYIPNVFKPNSLENDRFRPYIEGNCHFERFEIYDRWGELVFKSENINNAWDGKSAKGQTMNPGVYVYAIYLTDTYSGEQVVLSGDISLVR